MAIFGLFTNTGIAESIDAANNEGFFIFPKRFGVSDVAGALDPSRTAPTAGEFFTADVSSRVVVDNNTVKIVCTIPQGQTASIKGIKEVYLYAENSSSVEFLLALGQPSENLQYDPDGTVTLELQISLIDIDLTANYIFNNTMATELAEHETDPAAHPEIVEAMSKAGIIVPMGSIPFERRGQNFEENAEFDGTKAVGSTTGVVVNFSSVFNGTEGNSVSLNFDNVLTVDQVLSAWNNANPNNLITHDGAGTEVPPVQVLNLASGTYLVGDKQNVYKDVDGIYKLAIADGTIKTKAIGWARLTDRLVVHNGLLDKTSGFAVGTVLYLSSATAGEFTNVNNGVPLGIVQETDVVLYTGFNASADIEASQTFDAVVTDVTGLGLYESTDAAITAVPSGSRILIDKLEELKATIDPQGKTLDIVFNGIDKGWKRFAGQVASFRIDFDAVPDAGTWRFEWNGQESADMAFNVDATALQTEFNLFAGHTGVTVTGDYSSGFLFTFADEVAQPLPTFIYAGHNEKQRFNFGNIPDNGTITFEHDSNPTLNFPWDDAAIDLEAALEALASISSITVSGSFAAQYFEIEFDGGILLDGLQPRNDISVIASSLDQSATTTTINGVDPTVTLPIDPVTIIQGKYPASNMRTGGGANTPVVMTITEVSTGEAIGPDTAIIFDAANIHLTGYGLIKDFVNGIDVNGQDGAIIALRFENTTNPILQGDKKSGVDIDVSESLGFAKDLFAQLKISEHPTDGKRVKISGANEILASGAELAQELNSLLLDLDGAEIDFSTGEIFKADGATPLGLDFTPVIPAAEQFRWASITIIPKAVTSDGQLQGQVLVLFGDSDGASKVLANKAAFADGKPLGQIVLEGDLGEQEITRVIATRDIFSNQDGKHFIIYDDVGSVAVWNDVDDSGTAEPSHGALRGIEVTGIIENDDPNAVAIAIQTAVNADGKFTATVSDNRITITSSTIGERVDANVGTTSYTIDVLQQGRSTDATGLVDIKNAAIKQLGVGAGGGGGGAGAGDLFLQDLKFELKDGHYMLLDHNIGGIDADTKLDTPTTAIYSIPDKAFKFQSGEFIQSIDQLDDVEFLPQKVDISQVGITARWVEGAIDDSATFQISRDGGNEFQAVSMNRIGSTGTYYGTLEFANEAAKQTLSEYDVANADGTLDLDDTNLLQRSQEWTSNSTTDVYQQFTAYVNKLGSPLGNLFYKIVKDDAGDPSTDVNDIVFDSSAQDIASMSAGNNAIVISIPNKILDPSTKYHIVFYTDATYQASYDIGVDALSLRSDDSTPTIADSKSFNGTVWAGVSGSSLVYLLEGRSLDLRVKITSGTSNSLLLGYGVFYELETQVVSSGSLPVKFFDIAPTASAVTLALDWNPNVDFLEVINVYTGQKWVFPSFSISGNDVVFPAGTFDGLIDNSLLKVSQLGENANGNQDVNGILAILAESYIGSNNTAIGHGPIMKGPDGNNYEIYIDDNFVLKLKLKV